MGNKRLAKGLTLVEMLIATAILAYALCAVLATYVSCFNLISTSKDINIATNAAEGLMEQIRNTPFTQIVDDYDLLRFTVNNLPANAGIVYVNDTDPELLRITISVCWTQNRRVIGEDKNLNWVPEASEDLNGNNMIDSPVQLITLIANR